MTSATSFFNVRILRKDVTRFAPVWSLYTIFLAIMTLGILHGNDGAESAMVLGDTLRIMAWVNLFYALICAAVLFGDLYSARLCYALHAMPLRREGWFLTHVTAGVCFSLAPNLLVAVLSLSSLGEYWYAAFVWLLGVQLQHLFFFGVAVFCALCAGNRLAMNLTYAIVNFAALLVYWMAILFYEPVLYGFEYQAESFYRFSPAVYLSAGSGQPFWFLESAGTGAFWGYLTAIGVLGVVLLVQALLLYRRRQLESAGDFIAFKPMATGFRLVYTLAVGLLFYFFGDLFFYGITDVVYYGLMALGMVVGYFTAQMLLRRTVKVLRLRNVFGCGLIIALVALSIFVTALDPFGITRRVPEAEDVVSVSYSGYYSGGEMAVTDPEDIAALIDIHQIIVDGGSAGTGNTAGFSISYELSSGRELSRHYYIPRDGEAAQRISAYVSRPEYVLGYSDWERYVSSVSQVEVSLFFSDGETVILEDPLQIRELLEAVRADCVAGHITEPELYGKASAGTQVAWLGFNYNGAYSDRRYGLSIYSSYTQVWSWLRENLE